MQSGMIVDEFFTPTGKCGYVPQDIEFNVPTLTERYSKLIHPTQANRRPYFNQRFTIGRTDLLIVGCFQNQLRSHYLDLDFPPLLERSLGLLYFKYNF